MTVNIKRLTESIKSNNLEDQYPILSEESFISIDVLTRFNTYKNPNVPDQDQHLVYVDFQ